jgi:hypothetical protein
MRTRRVLYPGEGKIYSCELGQCPGCEGELQTAYTSKYKTVQTMQAVLRVGQRTKRCNNPGCRCVPKSGCAGYLAHPPEFMG